MNESYWDEEQSDSATNRSEWEDYAESSYYGATSEEEIKEMEYRIQEAILAEIALENDSTLFSMGHQFEDFVFECSFKGYDCRYGV